MSVIEGPPPPIIPPSLCGAVLDVFTIYALPLDSLVQYAVVRWMISPRSAIPDEWPIAFARVVREAREAIPDGLTLLVRSTRDDPTIVESWY